MVGMQMVDMARLVRMDVARRIPRLVDHMGEAGCDALLVTNRSNVRYLTGFTGSAGSLLVGPIEVVLVTDGRYGSQATLELAESEVEARIAVGGVADQRKTLVEIVRSSWRLGLESNDVTWARKRSLAEAFDGVELVATNSLVEDLRKTKDEGEVSRIATAAEIADEALAACMSMLSSSPTEVELALALDTQMRRLGASGSAFETIVATGPNAALPHARPSSRRIERGELTVIDFGAVIDGYRSDVTRTVCFGEPRSEKARRLVEVVAASQRAGVSAVREGVVAGDVDMVCRQVIEDAGWANAFLHGSGHGVGLDIHEAPSLGKGSADMLARDFVVTVEPGVYLEGEAGARIEDTVVVTAEGCRVLTKSPKDLVVS